MMDKIQLFGMGNSMGTRHFINQTIQKVGKRKKENDDAETKIMIHTIGMVLLG